jgi:hypothetical protein
VYRLKDFTTENENFLSKAIGIFHGIANCPILLSDDRLFKILMQMVILALNEIDSSMIELMGNTLGMNFGDDPGFKGRSTLSENDVNLVKNEGHWISFNVGNRNYQTIRKVLFQGLMEEILMGIDALKMRDEGGAEVQRDSLPELQVFLEYTLKRKQMDDNQHLEAELDLSLGQNPNAPSHDEMSLLNNFINFLKNIIKHARSILVLVQNDH